MSSSPATRRSGRSPKRAMRSKPATSTPPAAPQSSTATPSGCSGASSPEPVSGRGAAPRRVGGLAGRRLAPALGAAERDGGRRRAQGPHRRQHEDGGDRQGQRQEGAAPPRPPDRADAARPPGPARPPRADLGGDDS